VTIECDTNRLRELLHEKIEKRKKRLHPAHNPRFNHDLQLEIDCIKWALRKIEVNKIPNYRLDGLIQRMINDLEKRKDKAMNDLILMICGLRLKVFNGFYLLSLQ
jgi:hypothetical protein